MTCRELVEFLDRYVARELPAGEQAQFDAHLAECPPCVTFLESYQNTIAVSRALAECDKRLPPDVPEDLVQAILAARKQT